MTQRKHSVRRLIVSLCLVLGQGVGVFAPIGAQADEKTQSTWQPTAPVRLSGADLDRAFEIGYHLMRNKTLYRFMNEMFASNVGMPGLNARGTGLSLSQVVFVLSYVKKDWTKIVQYVVGAPSQNVPTVETALMKRNFRALFTEILDNEAVMNAIVSQNDPTKPLLLLPLRGEAGYSQIKMFVDHERLSNPDNPMSAVIPADDLRQVVIAFIKGAKQEIMYNVFDFDLMPIADALIERNKAGVKIHGGIDQDTVAQRASVKAVVDRLLPYEKQGLRTTLVDSVGLNHQKMIVRDAGTPDAAVLLLSGNFTQSCIGPEGDAVDVPADQRTPFSVPNANHAVFIKGQLVASVVKQELRKTLVYGVRGESNYPLGGAFQIMGPTLNSDSQRSWIMLTFSPNGGLGDINRDVLSRVIRETKGRIEALQFTFSSDILQKEIIARITKAAEEAHAKGKPAEGLFTSVGDTPFSMRGYSGFLRLSGLAQNAETSVYADDPAYALSSVLNATELKSLRANIRVAPAVYGERHIVMNGKSYPVTAKIHHKVFTFPDSGVAVVGTSFNPSSNAESNNEQIMVVRDDKITKQARGMMKFLFKGSAGSVYDQAMWRNKRNQQIPVKEQSKSAEESELAQ